MKLLRYESNGEAQLGVLRGDDIVSLAPLAAHYPTMLAIVAAGKTALDAILALAETAPAALPLDAAKLLAPIERPGKYLAIGMNYREHIEEAKRLGMTPPANQFWFNKQTSCLSGPYDAIDPGVSKALDYEVELCVVIGTPAKGVDRTDAAKHVFGYTAANDVSARDWQQHSPTFTMGKSFDTHGPIGPWIVTADEIPDPHSLAIRCLVNGELRQEATTGELVYDIWDQISYLSTAFTLESGDLIATGTPSGVGMGMQPPRFLASGDVVRCEIDGVGAIENTVL